MKKAKFNFTQYVANKFTDMGLLKLDEKSVDYQFPCFEAQTVCGRLFIVVYEDWVATRFDDVRKAVDTIRHGTLNRFSGKWNWMPVENMSLNDFADHAVGEIGRIVINK